MFGNLSLSLSSSALMNKLYALCFLRPPEYVDADDLSSVRAIARDQCVRGRSKRPKRTRKKGQT